MCVCKPPQGKQNAQIIISIRNTVDMTTYLQPEFYVCTLISSGCSHCKYKLKIYERMRGVEKHKHVETRWHFYRDEDRM